MATSFYDLSVATYLQQVNGVCGFLEASASAWPSLVRY